MTWPVPIRIVGIGSPHGDDALGWEAVRLLREQIGNRPEIETYLAHGGQRLLELLDGQGTLVLIDGVQSGEPPGTIHHIEWPDPRLKSMRSHSTHGMGLGEALRLAQALGIAPNRVVILAVDVASTGYEQRLGRAVKVELQKLIDLIAEVLKKPDNPNCCDHNNSHGQKATLRPDFREGS
jgi:hydrogenase maturation protease